ncbi:hypothetical protein [Pseudoduganella violaceinigra]|uniref:hypothetical protein n=1 Tax=Pseudoduganella violaceinigra TaxID=246602 RepID=UPI00068465E4|nr:hypothetical protein [Pseudoduganella violaceinigra]
MMATIQRLLCAIVPTWAKWSGLGALCIAAYGLGRLHEARKGADSMSDYVAEQAARAVDIGRMQTKVFVQTEIKYRDRIQKIYLKGEEIEKQVLAYVTPIDDAMYGVNAGFVLSYNAAWSGELAGPATSADRDAAGIPLAEVAEADAYNATVCHAWRELAQGLREHYQKQQAILK